MRIRAGGDQRMVVPTATANYRFPHSVAFYLNSVSSDRGHVDWATNVCFGGFLSLDDVLQCGRRCVGQ